MIPANELEYRDLSRNVDLLAKDIEELIEYKDVFQKFLKVSQNSIMMDLWMWKLKWTEEKAYEHIEAYQKLINNLEWLIPVYRDWKAKQEG